MKKPPKAPEAQPVKVKRRGRPVGTTFKPTPEQRNAVEFMAACGIPEDEMVALVRHPRTKRPISPKTLRLHFRQEINNGLLNVNMRVMQGLYKNATEPTPAAPHGNPTLQIFWAKTRLRWRDTFPTTFDELPPPLTLEDDETPPASHYEFARRIAFVLENATEREPKAAAKAAKKREEA